MTLLPEIRGQLLDAAFGDAGQPAPRSRRRWSGRLGIVTSTVVSLAIVVAAVLTLHHGSRPPSRPASRPVARTPLAWVNALGQARERTFRRDSPCGGQARFQSRRFHLRFLSTAPPRSITAILPSIASPTQGPARMTVKELQALGIAANGIYARYAWQGMTDGIRYYVVPAAVVGLTQATPAHCDREMLGAFEQEARRFPASQRAAAIQYARRLFTPAAEAGVAIRTVGAGGSTGSYFPIWRLAMLVASPDAGGGSGGNNNSTVTSLLVTDRVASITATYPAQSYPGRVPKTISITKRPVHNIVIFRFTGAWDPPQLTFRSSTGAIIARTRH